MIAAVAAPAATGLLPDMTSEGSGDPALAALFAMLVAGIAPAMAESEGAEPIEATIAEDETGDTELDEGIALLTLPILGAPILAAPPAAPAETAPAGRIVTAPPQPASPTMAPMSPAVPAAMQPAAPVQVPAGEVLQAVAEAPPAPGRTPAPVFASLPVSTPAPAPVATSASSPAAAPVATSLSQPVAVPVVASPSPTVPALPPEAEAIPGAPSPAVPAGPPIDGVATAAPAPVAQPTGSPPPVAAMPQPQDAAAPRTPVPASPPPLAAALPPIEAAVPEAATPSPGALVQSLSRPPASAPRALPLRTIGTMEGVVSVDRSVPPPAPLAALADIGGSIPVPEAADVLPDGASPAAAAASQAAQPADPIAAATPSLADTAVDRHLDLARDARWLDQLARDIGMAAANDGLLRFRLNPEHLGSLAVEVRQGAEGATIRMTADTEAARQIIADAQPKLLAEARAQGLRVSDAQVDLSHGRQQQQQQQPQPDGPILRALVGSAKNESTVTVNTPVAAIGERYA